MLKIPEKTVNQLATLASEADEVCDELDGLIETFNREVGELVTKLADLQSEAASLMEDEAADAESYYDEKTERWQEGDRGQAYGEWKDRLREIADNLSEAPEAPEVDLIPRPEWIGDFREPDFTVFEF